MQTNRKIPDLLLERFVAHDLPGAEAAVLDAAIRRDPALAARVEAIRTSNIEILVQYPAEKVAEAVLAGDPLSSWAGMMRIVVPLAATAAVLVAMLVPATHDEVKQTEVPATGPGESVRLKGDPQILVFRMEEKGPVPLDFGAPARAGDLLQIGIRPADASHGVLLSIDGRGAVTLHFPDGPAKSTALTAEETGVHMLPRSYQLDDAPRFERFVLVTSTSPIDVKTILGVASGAAGERDAPLDLPEGCRSVEFLVAKPEAPEERP